MKSIFLSSFIYAVIASCNNKALPISMLPLPMLNYDTNTTMIGKDYPIKSDFFLVRGYRNNEYCDSYIDSFVRKNADTSFINTGNSYSMTFYKESSETNIKSITKMKWKIIDRYSEDHDMIFDYGWQGKLYGKEKIKNGEVVNGNNKSEIELKEIQ